MRSRRIASIALAGWLARAVARVAVVAAAAWILAASPAAARNAYVVQGDGEVSVIDTQTNTVVETIEVGGEVPREIAITPDGSRAYVTNSRTTPSASTFVSVIDTATNAVVDTIDLDRLPGAVAIHPDGDTAYVGISVTDDSSVLVIDTATNAIGDVVDVPSRPDAIAITPDGARAYVVLGNGDVSVIDTATSSIVETIEVGNVLQPLAVTPDGTRAYVINLPAAVSVIDTATDAVVDAIDVGLGSPWTIAISPDGRTVYVGKGQSDVDDSVITIDTQTNAVEAIDVGKSSEGIAITPDGTAAYVAHPLDDEVSVIDTQTNAVVETIAVGEDPGAIAIAPNQPPVAALAADPLPAREGEAVGFDASASTDDEPIEPYRFDFGDDAFALSADPFRSHVYTAPGAYEATVTIDDGEGCPGFVFTGQTAHCNGPSEATSDPLAVEVREPAPPHQLRLRIRRPQRSLQRAEATATCEGAGCNAVARGRLRVAGPGELRAFSLRRFKRTLADGEPTVLRPPIPARARRAARRALRGGHGVRVRVRVRARAGGVARVRVRQAKLVR